MRRFALYDGIIITYNFLRGSLGESRAILCLKFNKSWAPKSAKDQLEGLLIWSSAGLDKFVAVVWSPQIQQTRNILQYTGENLSCCSSVIIYLS